MRITAFTLFLIFAGCKNQIKTEIKTEAGIDSTVYEMWTDFTQSNPEFKNSEIPESWFFHNNEKDADRLAKLTVDGKKKASSGLYLWYQEAKVDLPKIGTKHIVTDFHGKARAIIEIKKVDTIPFKNITKEYAELDMGTEVEPLEKWKKAHWEFFSGAMEEGGQKPTQKMLVVCEIFETIWTEKY